MSLKQLLLWVCTPFLLFACNHTFEDSNPESDLLFELLPEQIQEFIKQNYTPSRVMYLDKTWDVIDIYLLHQGYTKHALFYPDCEWINTSWKIDTDELPTIVYYTTNDPLYRGYRILNAEFVETPTGNYYVVEMAKGDNHLNLKIDEQGHII